MRPLLLLWLCAHVSAAGFQSSPRRLASGLNLNLASMAALRDIPSPLERASAVADVLSRASGPEDAHAAYVLAQVLPSDVGLARLSQYLASGPEALPPQSIKAVVASVDRWTSWFQAHPEAKAVLAGALDRIGSRLTERAGADVIAESRAVFDGSAAAQMTALTTHPVYAGDGSKPRHPQSVLARPTVVSRVGNTADVENEVRAIEAFLSEVPIFAKDAGIIDSLRRQARFGVHLKEPAPDDLSPMHMKTVRTSRGPQYELHIEREKFMKMTPGQRVFAIAHEFVHIADVFRLTWLLKSNRARIPKELFSDRREDIKSGRVVALPDGFHIERSFWIYLTEHRAYYAMNRLHDALKRNQFAKARFQGRHLELPPIERMGTWGLTATPKAGFELAFPRATGPNLIAALRDQRGYSPAALRRLNLPERLSPVTAFVLAYYLSDRPDSGQIDLNDPHLPLYAGLSIKEALSGAMLKRRDRDLPR